MSDQDKRTTETSNYDNSILSSDTSPTDHTTRPRNNRAVIWIVGGVLLVVIALAAGLAIWKGIGSLGGATAQGAAAITMKTGVVPLSEAQAYFEDLVQQYEYDGMDVHNEQTMSELKDSALKTLAQDRISQDQISKRNLGTVSEEDKEQAIADLDAELREVAAANESFFNPDGTLTSEQVVEEAQKYFDSMGMTHDALVAQAVSNIPYKRLLNEVMVDIKVSDEDIQRSFDEEVATAKAEYADDIFGYEITKMFYGADIPYTPAGYRGVRHILLAIPEDIKVKLDALQSELNTLQSDELDMEGTTPETDEEADASNEPAPTDSPEKAAQASLIDAKQEEINALIATIPDALAEQIAEVQRRLADGESFTTLIEELGTDPGMKAEPQKTIGYEVHKDSIQYDEAFTAAAMGLAKIGDISEPTPSQFGIHFVEYTRDVPEGPAQMTEAKRKVIEDQLLQGAQQAAFDAQFDAWFTEYEVVMHPELLTEPVHEGEFEPVETN